MFILWVPGSPGGSTVRTVHPPTATPPCPCSQTCKTGSELGLHLSWSADCGVQNSSMKNDRHGAKNSFPNNVKVKNFD